VAKQMKEMESLESKVMRFQPIKNGQFYGNVNKEISEGE
jgi:hypothetical protein